MATKSNMITEVNLILDDGTKIVLRADEFPFSTGSTGFTASCRELVNDDWYGVDCNCEFVKVRSKSGR